MTIETYKGKTRKQWAIELGMKPRSFSSRVQDHGFPKAVAMGQLMSKGKHSKSLTRLFTYSGKSLSLKQWAAELGMSFSGFNRRVVKYGFDIAVNMPVMPPKTKIMSKYYRSEPIFEIRDTVPVGKTSARLPKTLGISHLVGKIDEMPVPSAASKKRMSLIIQRGLDRGQIICAETGKQALQVICRSCDIYECGVLR